MFGEGENPGGTGLGQARVADLGLQARGLRSIALRSHLGAWPRAGIVQLDWSAERLARLCGDSTAVQAVTARKAAMAYSTALAAFRLRHRPFSRGPKAYVHAKWVIQPAGISRDRLRGD